MVSIRLEGDVRRLTNKLRKLQILILKGLIQPLPRVYARAPLNDLRSRKSRVVRNGVIQ